MRPPSPLFRLGIAAELIGQAGFIFVALLMPEHVDKVDSYCQPAFFAEIVFML